MSNSNYIMRKRTIYLNDLKEKHPFAFLIYDSIAERANREYNPLQPLLLPGEAIITAKACGCTDQTFETGLKILEQDLKIEILHRGRRDKNSRVLPRIKPGTLTEKSRNTSRINGTVVKILTTNDYDINIIDSPDHIPIQTRNTSPENPGQTINKEVKEVVCSVLFNEKILDLDFIKFAHTTKKSISISRIELQKFLESKNYLKLEIDEVIEILVKSEDKITLNGTIEAYAEGILKNIKKNKPKIKPSKPKITKEPMRKYESRRRMQV